MDVQPQFFSPTRLATRAIPAPAVNSTKASALDEIAQLAALLCDAPYGILIRIGRSSTRIVGSYGSNFTDLGAENFSVNRSVAETGVCRVIPDATQDSRLASHPKVKGAPFVRFLASAPVQAIEEAGIALGTLCVADHKPRDLSPAQRTGLEMLARQAALLLRRPRTRASCGSGGDTKLQAQPRNMKEWLVRSRFLEGLTKSLMGENLDPLRRAQVLAKRSVPSFADFCMVFLLSPHPGQLPRRAAFAHRDPEKQKLSHWRIHENFNIASVPPLPELIATQRSILVEDFGSEMLPWLSLLPEQRRLVEGLAARSGILVHLHGASPEPSAKPQESKSLGFVLFGTTGTRLFTQCDLALAEELAQRAGLAIHNSLDYEKASEAVRGRDDLLAMVSHDLRNPLSAIALNAKLLGMKIASAAGPSLECARQLQIIRQSSHRMSRLITDLLQLRQIDFTKLTLERGTHSSESLLEEVKQAFESLATLQGIQLAVDELSPELGFVDCDRDRVLQVFSNLVGNAIRFTPSGGQITLRAVREANTVTFSVADTGRGISQDELPHLFDRYWHARKVSRGGTGLGLSISKGIIETHGCRIWASSQLGQGTSIYFTLPAV